MSAETSQFEVYSRSAEISNLFTRLPREPSPEVPLGVDVEGRLPEPDVDVEARGLEPVVEGKLKKSM